MLFVSSRSALPWLEGKQSERYNVEVAGATYVGSPHEANAAHLRALELPALQLQRSQRTVENNMLFSLAPQLAG
jgi:hypothetical protein